MTWFHETIDRVLALLLGAFFGLVILIIGLPILAIVAVLMLIGVGLFVLTFIFMVLLEILSENFVGFLLLFAFIFIIVVVFF